MVSIPSALMLLVIALVGAVGFARATSPLSPVVTVASQRGQELRANAATPESDWPHAVRTDVDRPARSSIGKRDGSPDRRERTTTVDPAWIPLAQTAAHASLTAGLVLHARASARRTPGLPAPSSRAPPIV
jgi:hypothetical protein